jgi:hypothetical protein
MEVMSSTRQSSISRVVFAAALFVSCEAQAQVPFTSSEGGYSVVFPVKPQDQVSTKEGIKVGIHLIVHDQALFLSSEGLYESDVPADEELRKDVDNFASGIKGKVTSRRATEFAATSGEKLSAVEFSVDGEKQVGWGIVIVTGPRSSCLFWAASYKPANRRAAVDRFLQSVEIKGRK